HDPDAPAAAVEELLQRIGSNRLGTLAPGGAVYLAGAAALLRSQATRQDALTLAQRVWEDCQRADVPLERLAGFFMEVFAHLGSVTREATVALPAAVTDDAIVEWHFLLMNEPGAAKGEPSLVISRWLLSRGEAYGAARVLMDVAPALRANAPAYDAVMDTVAEVAHSLCLCIEERTLALGAAVELLDAAPRPRPERRRQWQDVYAMLLLTAMMSGERDVAHAVIARLLERFDSTAQAQATLHAHMTAAGKPTAFAGLAAFIEETFADPTLATPRVARLLGPATLGITPEQILALVLARAAVAPLHEDEALSRALDKLCDQPEVPAVLHGFLAARCAGGVDARACPGVAALLDRYLGLAATDEVRRQRLDEVCGWIGIPVSGPVPSALAEGAPGREVALRLLVGVGEHLLALAPSRPDALRRLRFLGEELAVTPGTTALLHEVTEHATQAGMTAPAGNISLFLLALLGQHIEAGRLQVAREVLVHLYFYLLTTAVKADAKTSEVVACRMLKAAEAFETDDRYAISTMVKHLRGVLLQQGAGLALTDAINAVLEDPGAASDTVHDSHPFRLMRRELVETVAHMVGPAGMTAFYQGVLNLLEAGPLIADLSPPRARRLHSALTEALADPLRRESLVSLLRAWANGEEVTTTREPWRAARVLARALASAGEVGATDVAAWLKICAKRYAEDGAEAWEGIARGVLDAASAPSLAAHEDLLEPVRKLLRGSGRDARKIRPWGAPLLRRLDDKVRAGR
ncbi:MAG TPA: hypothetical protein VFH51_04495, partial [Myxococcota bacterium]|nr:hypothetical protein [Myxococcota bacterium]